MPRFFTALLLAIAATNVFALSATSAYTPTIYPIDTVNISNKHSFSLTVVRDANESNAAAAPGTKRITAPMVPLSGNSAAHALRRRHHHIAPSVGYHQIQHKDLWSHVVEQTGFQATNLFNSGRVFLLRYWYASPNPAFVARISKKTLEYGQNATASFKVMCIEQISKVTTLLAPTA
jgi:hypothetical protein